MNEMIYIYIYIHLDKKTPISNSQKQSISDSVKASRVEWVDRIKVSWAGYSQIKAELILLKAATKTYHQYYHLISGADLPIKTQDEMHAYFDKRSGTEFISVEESSAKGYDVMPRIGQYHFLQDKIGRNLGIAVAVLERVERLSLRVQKAFRIDRTKKDPIIYKGANWFSITHDMAKYVISRQRDIAAIFSFGIAVDELFVQTLAMSSPYVQHINRDCKRLIDWERGNPYTWRKEDFQEIMDSDAFWARKFDYSTEPQIVDAICATLSQPKK